MLFLWSKLQNTYICASWTKKTIQYGAYKVAAVFLVLVFIKHSNGLRQLSNKLTNQIKNQRVKKVIVIDIDFFVNSNLIFQWFSDSDVLVQSHSFRRRT